MRALYDLKDKLSEELDDIARKPEMSAGDLETVHKLTDTIKNIDKICALEDEGYSEAGDMEHYRRGNSYGGRYYVRGHYDTRHGDRSRYSRGDGRSEMMEHLEAALDTATEEDRDAIKRFMREIKNA